MYQLTNKKKSKKNKYFKKYFSKINIIKYGGGPLAMNTFRIYTTGIADDGNTGETSYGYEWNQFVRNRVLELIPFKYTNIEIYHHDILYREESPAEKQAQIDFINNTVVANDLRNERVRVSIFLQNILNINTSSPYIIFDYAHLFTYINPKKVSCNTIIRINDTIYPRDIKIIPIDYRGDYINRYELDNIKSVYLGYNEPTEPRCNYIVKLTDVFTVDTSGKVQTYIDKYFIRQLPTEINETLTPKKVNDILNAEVSKIIKSSIGPSKFNELFARSISRNWLNDIIKLKDNGDIKYSELITKVSGIAIKIISENSDKNEDFWCKFTYRK
jgi:hypothetical protein